MESPEIIFGELFKELHRAKVHEDGKKISDAIPLKDPSHILSEYHRLKADPDFSLIDFFNEHFEIQKSPSSGFVTDTNKTISEHIESLWQVLQRKADVATEGSSLIPLPNPYIVPGGRFNEIYYWDSYFTMLGLEASKRFDLIESMLDNFAYLIDLLGFIPNGNRTYFSSRSQPPFFSLMVKLLAEAKGSESYSKFKPYLEKEYSFWMNGINELSQNNLQEIQHVVKSKDGTLNRYFDSSNLPRPEMYFTDEEDQEKSQRSSEAYFSSIRAACESGWDFSSRWLDESLELKSIKASEILPIDLNCLLYHLEHLLSEIETNSLKANRYKIAAQERKSLINRTFWSEENAFFYDFNFKEGELCKVKSLAAVYPLFFKIASKDQATSVAYKLENEFLKDGGLISTTLETGQQWDAPNGWAPLQWMSIIGLRNYGFTNLADQVKQRWINLNTKVFLKTGKLLEKYNVVNMDLETGGGEYPVQDGFGWTNGVLLKLLSE